MENISYIIKEKLFLNYNKNVDNSQEFISGIIEDQLYIEDIINCYKNFKNKDDRVS